LREASHAAYSRARAAGDPRLFTETMAPRIRRHEALQRRPRNLAGWGSHALDRLAPGPLAMVKRSLPARIQAWIRRLIGS
jgi:hypothetical protein